MGSNSDGVMAWRHHVQEFPWYHTRDNACDLSNHAVQMKDEMLAAFEEPIQNPAAIQLYTSFAALAISKQIDVFLNTDDDNFSLHLEACTINMTVILSYMKLKDVQLVPKRLLILPIRKFLYDTTFMSRKDLVELGQLMKSALDKVYPLSSVDQEKSWEEIGKHIIYGDNEMEEDLKHTGVLFDKKELRKLNKTLTNPKYDFKFMDHKASLMCFYGINKEKNSKGPSLDALQPSKKQLFQSNALSFMLRSDAASILAGACLDLPFLSSYVAKFKEAAQDKNCIFTSSTNDANQVKNSFAALAEEITFVLNLFSTQDIFEPLSSEVIEKISLVSMACLYCALNTAQVCALTGVTTVLPRSNSSTNISGGPNEPASFTPNRDNDSILEQHAFTIVEKSTELFDCTYSILKSSYRVFQSVIENHFFLGAWVLFTGLHTCLSKEDTKLKSPIKLVRTVSQKILLNFNNLFVTLASHALYIFDVLVSDASFTFMSEKSVNVQDNVEDISLSIMDKNLNPSNRIQIILDQFPFLQFLLDLAFLSFKKSLFVKKISKSSSSSKQNYYLEELSDESVIEEDEDSEPILGQWFEETIANLSEDACKKSTDDKSSSPKEREKDTSSASKKYFSTYIQDKGEPAQYTLLAVQALKCLTRNFSPTTVPQLIKYEEEYYNHNTATLAAFINSMDRDTVNNDVDLKSATSPSGDEKSSSDNLLSEDFFLSHALKTYVDYLMTTRIIKGQQEFQFLSQLNVQPHDSGPWPLVIYRRALCILLQSLLLKKNDVKQADIMVILRRVINTLSENATKKNVSRDSGFEDLNFEHSLFLIYMFHLLDLMYRKSIFLDLAHYIVQVAQVMDFSNSVSEGQLLATSRLLQLFDYMLRHLYDPPARIMQLMNDVLLNFDKMKTSGSHEELLKVDPKFYTLAVYMPGPRDTPKLDGLAWSFLLGLGSGDKVQYKDIINNLFILIEVNNLLTPAIQEKSAVNANDNKTIEYCFNFAWKLLMALPPSMDHLADVTRRKYDPPQNLATLYYLIWGVRATLPNYNRWLLEMTRRVNLEDSQKEAFAASLAQFTTLYNDPKFLFDLARSSVSIHDMDDITDVNEILPPSSFPSLNHIIYLEGLFLRLQSSMTFVEQMLDINKINKSSSNLSDSSKYSSDNESSDTSTSENYAKPLAPEDPNSGLIEKFVAEYGFLSVVTNLFQRMFLLCNSTILCDIREKCPQLSNSDLLALRNILPVATNRCTARYFNQVSAEFSAKLPESVRNIIQTWSAIDVHPIREYKSYYHTGQIFEDEMTVMLQFHTSQITHLGSNYKITPSLKSLLYTLVTFIGEFAIACPAEHLSKSLKEDIISLFLPLSYDACSGLLEQVSKLYIERVATNVTKEGHQYHSHLIYAKHLYRLIVNHAYKMKPNSDGKYSSEIDEHIFLYSVDWFRSMVIVSESSKLMALERFFQTEQENDVLSIAFAISSPTFIDKPAFTNRVIHFLNQIFCLAEDIPNERTICELCFSICQLTLDAENCPPFLKQVMTTFPMKTKDIDETAKQSVGGVTHTTPIITLGISTNNTTTTTPNENDSKKTDVKNTPSTLSMVSDTSMQTRVVSDESTENVKLLRHMVHYMIKYNLHDEALCFLQHLIPLTHITNKDPQRIQFPELITLLSKLADFVDGRGHQQLFDAAIKWLKSIKKSITTDPGFKSIALGNDGDLNAVILENISYLLVYISEFNVALFPKGLNNILSNECAGESEAFPPPLDLDIEWNDEITHDDDDESAEDDSDEDNLCNKLCTYTITQKEFMNQHWYHCHTCGMIEGVGVCSVCAQVCHKNHDITYSKFGNFFCDCGAKENGQCMALTKRNPQESSSAITSASLSHQDKSATPSSLRQRSSFEPILSNSYIYFGDENYFRINQIKIDDLREKLEPLSPTILSKIWEILPHILEVFQELKPALKAGISKTSPVGVLDRVNHVLFQLHNMQHKFVEHTDNLMVPIMGSQEGAFENVRMNSNGDQGQMIRQLISNSSIRRTCMCILSSPVGKRQHLVAVSHEKGKITLLQLGGLLKQIDSSKRKLTLIKLASVSLPITILSVVANPCNEELLAVCGLKECFVLSFTSGMSQATDSITINPHCETSNYIIKALWIPGRQSTLAIVTALNIKIYQLDKDVTHPYLYFVLPTGKIRDATFVCEDNGACAILIMSSIGVIYTQNLQEVMPYSSENSAEQQFYVTQTMNTLIDDITDDLGAMNCGGVSIYFSHTLRLLFFSYSNGKSFLAPIPQGQPVETIVAQPTLLIIGSSRIAGTPISKGNGQPLYQWMEVPHHPGLIFAMMQCNTPVALTIKPHIVKVQEIKLHPFGGKSKFLDMVAINHNNRTTLILLCEDGSLRIYNDNPAETNFWLAPELKATSNHTIPKALKRKKTTKTSKPSGSSPVFPIDFFEHCTLLTEIEFGGKDLLQLYNAAQVKNRFNTTGLYVVISKAPFVSPIAIEIKNNDSSMVIAGIRVLLGAHDPTKNPKFIEVYNRTITVTYQRNRWYNIPLTREEILQSDKSLTLKFGCSGDLHGIQIIDSISVYGKSKDQFGWPDEAEDVTSINANSIVPVSTNDSNSVIMKMNRVEKVMGNILHTIDVTLKLKSLLAPNEEDNTAPLTNQISDYASEILVMPVSASLVLRAKSLLACVHTSRVSYHNFIDEIMLKYAYDKLNSTNLDGSLGIDSEEFFRILLMVRSIAIHRMHNLNLYGSHVTPGPWIQTGTKDCIQRLLDVMWLLLKARPKNPAISSVVIKGLTHVESVIHAMVDVLHQLLMSDNVDDVVKMVSTAYSNLLLTQDVQQSSTAKQAIIRVLRPRFKKRRVFIPTPPVATQTPPRPDSALALYDIDAVESISLLGASNDNIANNEVPVNVEALLGAASFPQLIDIPPDADDEAMVELAIALSLQEVQQGLQEVQQAQDENQQRNESLQSSGVSNPNNSMHNYSHYSDATLTPGGSDDDEGSTAATEGSTLRTSPAEQVGSAGSESGGSGADSITGEQNVSGRSSAYGDTPQDQPAQAPKGDGRGDCTSSTNTVVTDTEIDNDLENETLVKKLHVWRISILKNFLDLIPKLKDYSGVQVIPFFQVVLMLASDLDCGDAQDKAVLEEFIPRCITEVTHMVANHDIDMLSDIVTPSMKNERESLLVLLRFLSVLMMRSKNKSGNDTAIMTAAKLYRLGFLNLLKFQLSELLQYWREKESEEKTTPNTPVKNVLKPRSIQPLPDFTPFFLKSYVKNHTNDIFENYPDLLTEILVRLTYQILKHINVSNPEAYEIDSPKNSWYYLLCEYMMIQHTQIRRQVRKLLMYICSTKEKYRRYRDFHALESHMKAIRRIITSNCRGYEDTVELVEHLKGCADVSSNRVANWQRYCVSDPSVLEFFFMRTIGQDEPIAHFILNLILAAVIEEKDKDGTVKDKANVATIKDKKGTVQIVVANTVVPSSSSATSYLAPNPSSKDTTDSDADLSIELVKQIHKVIAFEVLWAFIKTFLLESNNVSIRWQCHSLTVALYQNCDTIDQENMLDLLWSLWPSLHAYGRKATQFTDVLSYFTMQYIRDSSHDPARSLEFVNNAVESLRNQNQLLANHPNKYIYTQLSKFVELDGFYLETHPCPVCNNPEISFTNIKLSAVKIDSKFTTNTQIVKLVGSHTISKISLRIADLKRTKMVKTINIYYNNKNVQAVIELKNRTTTWNKAKKVSLESGQTEVKIEFPLPIVACNLMIEYFDFFENMQANSENLLCPRCSATVPANPGVCSNCGENAFQCHKCRAINYDEKDPFLCHACGFCKYAKFDYVITARPCCTVDAITNDEERAKAITTINSQLDKANMCYRQLTNLKPALLSLLERVEDRVYSILPEDMNHINSVTASVAAATGNAQGHGINVTSVNKVIQVLAHRYSVDSKNAFEELSRTLQQVLASLKELLKYDKLTVGKGNTSELVDIFYNVPHLRGECYACSFAVSEHCLTLIRALSNVKLARKYMRDHDVVDELMKYSLKHGTAENQFDVKQIICFLVCDDAVATTRLCESITQQVLLTIKLNLNTPLRNEIRNEIAVLAALKDWNQECSEIKVRCVLKLFFLLLNEDPNALVSIEHHLQNVLDIIHSIIYPDIIHPNRSNQETLGNKSPPKPNIQVGSACEINFVRWIKYSPECYDDEWKKGSAFRVMLPLPTTPSEVHSYYLKEKFWLLWRKRMIERKSPLYTTIATKFPESNWLKQLLFNPHSAQLRETACSLVKIFCMSTHRKKDILDMLIGYLDELTEQGDVAIEYLVLMEYFVVSHWRIYMAVKGVLTKLADLFTYEIEILHGLEETTLYFDLTQGLVLHRLTEIVACFLEEESIKNKFKGRLVAAVLNGYLSLRRLVVQRTNHVDKAQEKLLGLLEEMTSGTEEETKSFMSICTETVKNCSTNDIRTPVFVFERLCSIIHPEDSEVGEFLMTLEKDSQQEDFLQGRMLGNPYKSSDPGLGPLMRDIKNKICQDCELVALLDDDNGMELLVNNKIVSLDLPVAQVYRKVWAGDGGDGDVMRIIYRMRGLLGDATEEFIENLDPKKEEEVNNEQVYRMANVMAECGGIDIIVEQLSRISDLNRDRQLLQVILKLLRLCVKVKSNQVVLAKPELNAMGVLLGVLQLCLEVAGEYTVLTEQLLEIMESTISKVALETPHDFAEFSKTFGGLEHVSSLLQWITMVGIKPNIMKNLNRVIAALTYGNKEKMILLTDYFIPDLDFEKFDQNHSSEESRYMNIFCSLIAGIDRTPLGNTLKDHIVSLGVVEKATQYILTHAPMKSPCISFYQPDQDDWKEFISKPALKYVLYLLTGLSYDHELTQTAVADRCIPVIHRLEQVSSDEHVGTMAENLLEALSTNPTVAEQVETVRERTKAKKKRLALAAREKQLGALGMKSNEKGQVVTAQASSLMQQLEDLGEETGLVCVICREGYKYQPSKVLGIYTFTKRGIVEEFESKPRKTVGYSTVTHFNVVHTECHMAAVRLARTREEWESAALQNANTKCNGILPLWGPQVPESLFASSLARHNSYLQECTGLRDILYGPTIHDLKLLLLRFAHEKSFHEDAGGGGPQSNMHLIPYLVHMALYVINTTRSFKREDQNLCTYLELDITSSDKMESVINGCYEADGPHYFAVLSVAIHSHSKWREYRVQHLRRLLLTCQVRHMHPSIPDPLNRTFSVDDKQIKDWKVYKSTAIFFALIDQIYTVAFGNVPEGPDEQWPTSLADYIRNNDEPLLKACEKLMNIYSDKLLSLDSLESFFSFIDPEKKMIADCHSFVLDLFRPL